MLSFILALCFPLWQESPSTDLITDDQAIQFVEADPEAFLEFAASRPDEPLTISVSAWLESQPTTYSGLRDRIRDRRRAKGDVEKDKKGILDKINRRKIDRKEARTEVLKAKGDRWRGLAWTLAGAGVLVLGLVIGLVVIVGLFK